MCNDLDKIKLKNMFSVLNVNHQGVTSQGLLNI